MAGVTFSLPEALATAAAAVAVAGSAAGLYSWCRNLYRRSIGSRQDHSRRFSQLATGVTIRYVEERFGAPAFVNDASFGRDPDTSVKLTSRVYYTRHAWLQVLTNKDEAVVRFSITVTDPRFRFPIQDLTFGSLKVTLGYSHFAVIDQQRVWGRYLMRDVQGHCLYSESYPSGTWADNQKFVLSYNDAGTGSFGSTPHIAFSFQDGDLLLDPNLDAKKNPEYAIDTTWARQFRAQTIINTLTVFNQYYVTLPDSQEGYQLAAARFLISPGVSSQQARLLPDASGRRGQHQVERA